MSKTRTGIVVSTSMDKTAVVKVDRMVPHPIYGKQVRMSAKFAVHDPKNSTKVGDIVTIEETRPVSKRKNWRLVRIDTTNEVSS
jgi:small subunit ribosomal protein S17